MKLDAELGVAAGDGKKLSLPDGGTQPSPETAGPSGINPSCSPAAPGHAEPVTPWPIPLQVQEADLLRLAEIAVVGGWDAARMGRRNTSGLDARAVERWRRESEGRC